MRRRRPSKRKRLVAYAIRRSLFGLPFVVTAASFVTVILLTSPALIIAQSPKRHRAIVRLRRTVEGRTADEPLESRKRGLYQGAPQNDVSLTHKSTSTEARPTGTNTDFHSWNHTNITTPWNHVDSMEPDVEETRTGLGETTPSDPNITQYVVPQSGGDKVNIYSAPQGESVTIEGVEVLNPPWQESESTVMDPVWLPPQDEVDEEEIIKPLWKTSSEEVNTKEESGSTPLLVPLWKSSSEEVTTKEESGSTPLDSTSDQVVELVDESNGGTDGYVGTSELSSDYQVLQAPWIHSTGGSSSTQVMTPSWLIQGEYGAESSDSWKNQDQVSNSDFRSSDGQSSNSVESPRGYQIMGAPRTQEGEDSTSYQIMDAPWMQEEEASTDTHVMAPPWETQNSYGYPSTDSVSSYSGQGGTWDTWENYDQASKRSKGSTGCAGNEQTYQSKSMKGKKKEKCGGHQSKRSKNKLHEDPDSWYPPTMSMSDSPIYPRGPTKGPNYHFFSDAPVSTRPAGTSNSPLATVTSPPASTPFISLPTVAAPVSNAVPVAAPASVAPASTPIRAPSISPLTVTPNAVPSVASGPVFVAFPTGVIVGDPSASKQPTPSILPLEPASPAGSPSLNGPTTSIIPSTAEPIDTIPTQTIPSTSPVVSPILSTSPAVDATSPVAGSTSGPGASTAPSPAGSFVTTAAPTGMALQAEMKGVRVTANPIALESSGPVDLAAAKETFFNVTMQAMQQYLNSYLGPVLEEFNMKIIFQKSQSSVQPVEMTGSTVIVNSYFVVEMDFKISSDDIAILAAFSQKRATDLVMGFFNGISLTKLLALLDDSGIRLESIRLADASVVSDGGGDSGSTTAQDGGGQVGTEDGSGAGSGSSDGSDGNNAFLYACIAGAGGVALFACAIVYAYRRKRSGWFDNAEDSIMQSLYSNGGHGPPAGKALPVLSPNGISTTKTFKTSSMGSSQNSTRTRVKPAALTLRSKHNPKSQGSASTLGSMNFSLSPVLENLGVEGGGTEEKEDEEAALAKRDIDPEGVAGSIRTNLGESYSLDGDGTRSSRLDLVYSSAPREQNSTWSVDGLTIDDDSEAERIIEQARQRRWHESSSGASAERGYYYGRSTSNDDSASSRGSLGSMD